MRAELTIAALTMAMQRQRPGAGLIQYPDRGSARDDLFAYIERYYNRRRIHSAIGYITPQQAEANAA